MKTIERAHSPAKMWEKIKLKANYVQALAQIDEHLEYWPKFLVHKAKQRLTKIHQYLIRMRKLQLNDTETLVTINRKRERREATREKKALSAAQLDQSIKKELLERLKKNVYGDIYSFPQKHFDEALNEMEAENELDEDSNEESDIEFVEGDSDLEDFDLEDYGFGDNRDFDDSDDEDDDEDDGDNEDRSERKAESSDEDSDSEGSPVVKKPLRKRPKRSHITIEYEHEQEQEPQETAFE